MRPSRANRLKGVNRLLEFITETGMKDELRGATRRPEGSRPWLTPSKPRVAPYSSRLTGDRPVGEE